MLKRYIGDKPFYRRMLTIATPIILQNFITNFVSLLDNVMVGQLSTAQLGGVTIVNNNLLFIFILTLYGGAAGAGIFTTQYYGKGDNEGIRHTFRFKLLISTLLTVAGLAIFLLFDDQLVGLYLQGEGDATMAADTLYYGKLYLQIMLIGLLPFAVTNAYAGTLRECGKTLVPMVAGFVATGVNLCFNYVLIFGHLGAPQLGVAGAAIATVIARFTEMAIVVIWAHAHTKILPFLKGLYRSFYIPAALLKSIILKGMPLLVNELGYALGMAVLNQCYSTCGLAVLPALSISTTIYNLGSVVYRSLGNTVGIITGQMLGASLPEKEVRDSNRKMTAFGVFTGVVFGALLIVLAGIIPKAYNTTDEVRNLATWFIIISSCAMPLQAYIFPVYFTLRSGGKTMITFAFDCGANWLLAIPIAFILSRFTNFPILLIFAICHSIDIPKSLFGLWLIKRGTWIQNITVP